MANIFVQTFGCSANFAEGEIIKGLLSDSNHNIIQAKEEADVIILNICTVKGNQNALKEIKKTNQDFPETKLIIAGCIPLDIIPEVRKIAYDVSFINTHNINQIITVVEEALADNPIEILTKTNLERINLPRIRHNPIVGIIPISNGCDSACTFCSVKFIKGNTKSYAPETIINELKQCIIDGCKEIWLTSQDTGCYGHDINTNIVELLKKIIQVQGDFKIRLGMANPKHIKNYYKELVEIYKSNKMFKFLHIPVQSGSDFILEKMRRDHTAQDYIRIIDYFRTQIPEMTFSTDIICGFPGETREMFEQTLELIKITKTDVVNISRFSARERTLAEKMPDQISEAEKKQRSTELTNIFWQISEEQNKKWIDWEGEIIIDEKGKNNEWLGRNYAYKQVVVNGSFELGQKINVKITSATKFALKSIVLEKFLELQGKDF